MTATLPPRRSLAERTVEAITDRLATRTVSRRRLLARTTVVAAALAVDPLRYLLRPGSAMATVCGSGTTCGGGWTAFCCTINDGANTCPEGSFAAGWWKVDASAFCKGQPRYYIDCNRIPTASCSCTCADGACDQRKVCCNVFRYGQCHLEVPGVTEVVCRVISCTVPWEWDPGCSDTVRTDNRTATHSSTCLPGTDASWIEIRYQDIGLVGSVVGAQDGPERDTEGGGRRTRYDNGTIAWTEATGACVLDGPFDGAWDRAGGPGGPLGHPTADARDTADDTGRVADMQGGAIWASEAHGAFGVDGLLHTKVLQAGGPGGFLGYPVHDVETVPGPWRRVRTAGAWQVVEQTERGDARILPVDVTLPEDGSWPDGVDVDRWAGADRIATSAEVARRTWPEGTTTAVVASARDFADALTGGVAAAVLGGPLLLVEPDRLTDPVVACLRDLGVERAVVLGGERAVSVEVERALGSLVRRVRRWAGEDRHATAVEISRRLHPDGAPVAVVATGREFADALAAVPEAVRAGGPLLLVDPDAVPDVVADEVRRLGVERVVVLGGRAAVSGRVVDRLRSLAPRVDRVAGDDRYATAAALADARDPDQVDVVLVANGTDFPDGLAAGAAGAVLGAPVVLSRSDVVPEVTAAAVERLRPRRVVLVGGARVLDRPVAERFAAMLVPAPPPEPEPTPTPTDGPTEEPTPTPTEVPGPGPEPTAAPTR